MTTKRKAELQRRLSMASVPKPPAGLADRIKSDIPDLLGTARERERLSSSIAFNMRVAASIILLVSSAYLCVRLLSRADRNEAAAPRMMQMAVKAAAPAKLQEQPVSQEAPAVPARVVQPPLRPQPAPVPMEREREVAEAPRDIPRDTPREATRNEETVTITAEAPLLDVRRAGAPAAAAAAPAAAPAPIPEPAPAPPPAVADGYSADFVSVAKAADIVQSPRDQVFGISVDTHAFGSVKGAIERGERPSAVNVEALINYFAGPPDRRAPREVALEVEASPAPVSAGPRAFIIRTTIDTARQELPPGASPLPVATNADLEVQLDGNAVVSHRRAGGGDETSGVEETLLKNVSVTAMFEVELRSNLQWRQPIATVRLRYRSVETGKEKTITRVIHASDVARPWSEASRRHRLATLGAMWSETLKNAPGATDVARRAEELASQNPKNAKARELAALASASSRLQSSGPTGSGR